MKSEGGGNGFSHTGKFRAQRGFQKCGFVWHWRQPTETQKILKSDRGHFSFRNLLQHSCNYFPGKDFGKPKNCNPHPCLFQVFIGSTVMTWNRLMKGILVRGGADRHSAAGHALRWKPAAFFLTLAFPNQERKLASTQGGGKSVSPRDVREVLYPWAKLLPFRELSSCFGQPLLGDHMTAPSEVPRNSPPWPTSIKKMSGSQMSIDLLYISRSPTNRLATCMLSPTCHTASHRLGIYPLGKTKS